MPNWCMNNLDITGPEKIIDELAEFQLCLQKIIPCPQELLDTTSPASSNDPDKAKSNTKKYGYPDWYSWQVSNWGTKWDIGPIECDPIDNYDGTKTLSVNFDSAWSPPVEAFKKIFEKYKDQNIKIRLEYFEPGCAFLGVAYIDDGEFIDDYDEYTNADQLEAIVKRQDNSLAEPEIEYLKEREAEEAQEAEEAKKVLNKTKKELKVEKKTKPNDKPKNKTKKVSVKKDSKKKAVKKKLDKKPVKKATKKLPSKKTIKK